MPLVAERLIYNIVALCNSFANIRPKRWHVLRKLKGNTCNELASMAGISTALSRGAVRRQEVVRKTVHIDDAND
jgi:hypothetical protein